MESSTVPYALPVFSALEFCRNQGEIIAMHPSVNCEEFIGKTVGKRRFPDSMLIQPSAIESSRSWREHGFRPKIRKGVYRFHSHEEADQWLMDRLTRKQKN